MTVLMAGDALKHLMSIYHGYVNVPKIILEKDVRVVIILF